MNTRLCHARRRVAGGIGALVVAVLVAPGLAPAPVHALSPLDPVLSKVLVDPDLVGAGTVTGAAGALSCTNATDATSGCANPLTLGDLGGAATDVRLAATPATGWEFSGWSGACSGSSPTCLLSSESLSTALEGTPLAPLATFTRAEGTADPNPLCGPSGGAAPGVDCDPPVTVLRTKPAVTSTSRSVDGAGVTPQRGATFTFAAVEPKEDGSAGTTPTPEATFACRLRKLPTTTGAFVACPGSTSGTATYDALADGTYEFAVQASDGEGNTDPTPETFTWTVDTTAPQTVFTKVTKFWVLARQAVFGVGVAAPDVPTDMSFQCYLDGAGRACDEAARFASGTHTFSATATDKAGNTDETRVTHAFTMPVNNTALAHSKGWTKANVKGAFLRTASVTEKKGAKLSAMATDVTRVALVASKGPGFGTVKVMLGKKTLKQVSLAQKRSVKKKVVPIARFSTPASGKITVQVVSSGKKVVIEGLGIATG